MNRSSKIYIRLTIRVLIISFLLIIIPLARVVKAELPVSINIFLRPAYIPTGERLRDRLRGHNIQTKLIEKKLVEMKALITKGQLSDRDFFLVSFPDLLGDPLLADKTKVVAVADDGLYVQIVTLSKHKIKEIIDLKGKRVSLGLKERPNERHALVALKAQGLNCMYDLTCKNYGIGAQVDKLLNGEIDAFFLTFYKKNDYVRKVALEADLDMAEIPISTVEYMKKIGQVPYRVAEIDLSVYGTKSKNISTAATYRELLIATQAASPSTTVERVGKVFLSYPLFGKESLPAVLNAVWPHVEFRSEIIPLIKNSMIE